MSDSLMFELLFWAAIYSRRVLALLLWPSFYLAVAQSVCVWTDCRAGCGCQQTLLLPSIHRSAGSACGATWGQGVRTPAVHTPGVTHFGFLWHCPRVLFQQNLGVLSWKHMEHKFSGNNYTGKHVSRQFTHLRQWVIGLGCIRVARRQPDGWINVEQNVERCKPFGWSCMAAGENCSRYH